MRVGTISVRKSIAAIASPPGVHRNTGLPGTTWLDLDATADIARYLLALPVPPGH